MTLFNALMIIAGLLNLIYAAVDISKGNTTFWTCLHVFAVFICAFSFFL